jgi:2-methylaconitate cis-trans-isomerase PrpF
VINRVIDTAPNCGNMLVGVAPFAIERGLVAAKDPETVVRIRNVNTGALVEATVQTPGGEVTYSGSTAIDGVPGKAAPVKLTFRQAVGSKTGKLFPTGQIREIVRGVEATLIDMSVPVVMMAAEALGKSGAEIPADLDGDREFIARLETIRIEAGHRMGFANAAASVLPKVILVSRALRGGTISGRYFMPHSCHKAFAVTGGICLATASLVGGTVANDVANWAETGRMRTCRIEHPMGQMLVEVELDEVGGVKRISLVRTARKLFAGKVYIPWNESSAL